MVTLLFPREKAMTDKIVVFTTCGSEEEAARIARLMVEERVAACVSVAPRVRSYYRWKGDVESAEEWLLIVKTSRGRFGELRAVLEKAHSYEVPEVVALPVVEGAPNYLAWIEGSLAR
jgi:periplasmic divalent cation tolerance protein